MLFASPFRGLLPEVVILEPSLKLEDFKSEINKEREAFSTFLAKKLAESDELDRRMEENTKRLKELMVCDKEELDRLELKRQIEELNEITKRLEEQLYS